MKRVVWKFVLALECAICHEFDHTAEIVHVGEQDGIVCIWAEVDYAAAARPRTFGVFGTGHPIPDGWTYRGTVQIAPFVWHVYEAPQ